MKKAKDRNLPFEFGHYIMICKLYKTKTDNSQDHQAVVFSNPEEELIVAESELCIDYDVADESDNDMGGNWTDGVEMNPWRRLIKITCSWCVLTDSMFQDCCLQGGQAGQHYKRCTTKFSNGSDGMKMWYLSFLGVFFPIPSYNDWESITDMV